MLRRSVAAVVCTLSGALLCSGSAVAEHCPSTVSEHVATVAETLHGVQPAPADANAFTDDDVSVLVQLKPRLRSPLPAFVEDASGAAKSSKRVTTLSSGVVSAVNKTDNVKSVFGDASETAVLVNDTAAPCTNCSDGGRRGRPWPRTRLLAHRRVAELVLESMATSQETGGHGGQQPKIIALLMALVSVLCSGVLLTSRRISGNTGSLTSTVWALVAASFFTYTVEAMPLAYFPDAALQWGLSESQIGLVIAAGHVPVFLCGGFAAVTSQRCGYKNVISLGLAACCISNLLIGLVPDLGGGVPVAFVLSLIARMLQGFGVTLVSVSSLCVAADSGPDRSLMIGFVNMGPGIAYVVGPAFGAMAYTTMGFFGVSILSATSLMLIMWPIGQAIPVREHPSPDEDNTWSLASVSGYPAAALVTLLLVFVSGLGVGVIDTTIAIEFCELDVMGSHSPVVHAGLALSALSLSFALASPIVGSAAHPEQYGARAVLSIAPWVLAASSVLAWVSFAADMLYGDHVLLLVLSLSLWGFGTAMVVAPAADFMVMGTGVNADTVAAQSFNALKLGTIIGSVVGPFTLEHWGSAMLFELLFAVVCLLGGQFIINAGFDNMEPHPEPTADCAAEASKTTSSDSDGGTGGTVQGLTEQ